LGLGRFAPPARHARARRAARLRALPAAHELKVSRRRGARQHLEPRRCQLRVESAVAQVVHAIVVGRGPEHRVRDAGGGRGRGAIAGGREDLGGARRQRLQVGANRLHVLGGGARVVQAGSDARARTTSMKWARRSESWRAS
jgi:hypothetical protein